MAWLAPDSVGESFAFFAAVAFEALRGSLDAMLALTLIVLDLLLFESAAGAIRGPHFDGEEVLGRGRRWWRGDLALSEKIDDNTLVQVERERVHPKLMS